MLRVDDVRNDAEVRTYIQKADDVMAAIGYTEHGMRHSLLVSDAAYMLLESLGHPTRRAELAAIAGLLHDVGNVAGRAGHEAMGAAIAARLLDRLGLPADEVCDILPAIGSHEAERGLVPDMDLCAAVILADKSDVHHTRVREAGSVESDIHDRVNAAARDARLSVDADARIISLRILIDPEMASPMEYFEIFLNRMVLSRRAAKVLGCTFELYINEARLA